MKNSIRSRLNYTGIHPFGLTADVNADRLFEGALPTFGAEKFGIVGNVYWGKIPALGLKSVNRGKIYHSPALFSV